MIRFTVRDGNDSEIAAVETISTDSFYNLRDQIHSDLETGEFGSRFPVFMTRYEPDEWSPDELDSLEPELKTIVDAFKKLPPEPHQASLKMWEEIRKGLHPTLCHVYRDASGQPLLESLLILCQRARKEARPLRMD